jgi:hypothetical protein
MPAPSKEWHCTTQIPHRTLRRLKSPPKTLTTVTNRAGKFRHQIQGKPAGTEIG